ncbi:MAG: TRAM domain-containing protein [Euzebyales bacterium]|nr:TRAM domain-containing protein [Euzebyales bacterium]
MSTSPDAGRRSSTSLLVGGVRLAVVALSAAAAYEFGGLGALPVPDGATSEQATLVVLVLGVLGGYLLGGIVGRFTVGRVDDVERSLHGVASGDLLAGLLGGLAGVTVGLGLTWPVLLIQTARAFTVPIAAFVVLTATMVGLRVGVGRGGDLLRALGASGRLTLATPAAGPRARVIDTSALIDGRIVDVCRSGFFDGTLVIPRFVLYELQVLADAGDDERRRRGRRGLEVLGALQRSTHVTLEVSDRDHPEIDTVDAKLVATALQRRAPLVTVDVNLARVAEVQGVGVMNLHQLAEDLRPPVLPGEVLTVRVSRPGKEKDQGVGYLADGTMVVVEGARDRQGAEVRAEVTSIMSNTHGRMVFATIATVLIAE